MTGAPGSASTRLGRCRAHLWSRLHDRGGRAALLVGPLLLVAAAAVLWVAAADIPVVPVPGQLGPDFWPRLALAGLAATSALKILQVLRRRGAVAEAAPRPPLRAGRLAGAAGCLALYVLLMPLVGFSLATVLFLVAFMALGGFARPLTALGWSVAMVLALLYLFVKVVYLPLPRGEGVFLDATLLLYRALGLI